MIDDLSCYATVLVGTQKREALRKRVFCNLLARGGGVYDVPDLLWLGPLQLSGNGVVAFFPSAEGGRAHGEIPLDQSCEQGTDIFLRTDNPARPLNERFADFKAKLAAARAKYPHLS